jgi:membrane protein implicated in regulation of membrane protease activity
MRGLLIGGLSCGIPVFLLVVNGIIGIPVMRWEAVLWSIVTLIYVYLAYSGFKRAENSRRMSETLRRKFVELMTEYGPPAVIQMDDAEEPDSISGAR